MKIIPEGFKVLHIAYEKEELIPTTGIKAFSVPVIVTNEQFNYIMANPERLIFEFPYEADKLIKDYRATVMAVLTHEDKNEWLLHKERRENETNKHKGAVLKCFRQ